MNIQTAAILGIVTAILLLVFRAPWWVPFVALTAYWLYLMVRVRRG